MKLFVDIVKTIIIAIETIVLGILSFGIPLQFFKGELWKQIFFVISIFIIIFSTISWISKKAEYWDVERSLRVNSCRKNREHIKWLQKHGLE